MNHRLIKAQMLLEVLAQGRILTAEQAQAIAGREELSRVLEIIRNRFYVPVTCRKTKPTSYSIVPANLVAYHHDRTKQISEQKAKKHASEYNRLSQRLIKKALHEKGGIARTRTLMAQVGTVIEQHEQAAQECQQEPVTSASMHN